MSKNTSMAFLVGAVVGAIVALLFAPKSGEELRAELVSEARAERDQLQKEYAEVVEEVRQRLDKVQADVQTTLEHVKEQRETAVGAK